MGWSEQLLTLNINSYKEMERIGGLIAKGSGGMGIIFVKGDLGAGKTVLSRGVLRGVGYEGTVKSPTYTLVEVYDVNGQTVHHFDLYRLKTPEELELIGVRDYFSGHALCLIEWPAQGQSVLPPPDLTVQIDMSGGDKRQLSVTSHTSQGQQIEDFLVKNV